MSIHARKRRWKIEPLQSFLLLLPSFLAIAIFVYAFIFSTFYVSISNWKRLKMDLSLIDPWYKTYLKMFSMTRFQSDIRNTIVFTALLILFATAVGLFLAILMDRELFGKTFFRNSILFPYSLSFVVTGVVWRWLFNPEAGINLFFEIFGINAILAQFGIESLQPGWTTDPNVWFSVNNILAYVWPAIGSLRVKLGVPAAMFPVAIAATWQLSGFVMATYLGGLTAIPDTVREAARIDGASEWQIYRHVIIPMLKPVTVSVVVILLHVSLKTFDLIWTMSGVGPGFATDMPSIFVFEMMFRANRFNLASAAAIVMLLLVGCVIVPYLVHTLREEK